MRFDHGQVSAGAVLREKNYRSIQDQSPESIWSSVVNKHDELKRLFQKAVPLYPLRKIKRVGFEMERTCGNRWIMLSSSAGFIDPLLSTGFPLTLQNIQRLASCLSPQSLRQPGPLAALSSLAKASKADPLLRRNDTQPVSSHRGSMIRCSLGCAFPHGAAADGGVAPM